MVEHCLACGHRETDYNRLMISIYFVCAWIFAVEVLVMLVQNRII